VLCMSYTNFASICTNAHLLKIWQGFEFRTLPGQIGKLAMTRT